MTITALIVLISALGSGMVVLTNVYRVDSDTALKKHIESVGSEYISIKDEYCNNFTNVCTEFSKGEIFLNDIGSNNITRIAYLNDINGME